MLKYLIEDDIELDDDSFDIVDLTSDDRIIALADFLATSPFNIANDSTAFEDGYYKDLETGNIYWVTTMDKIKEVAENDIRFRMDDGLFTYWSYETFRPYLNKDYFYNDMVEYFEEDLNWMDAEELLNFLRDKNILTQEEVESRNGELTEEDKMKYVESRVSEFDNSLEWLREFSTDSAFEAAIDGHKYDIFDLDRFIEDEVNGDISRPDYIGSYDRQELDLGKVNGEHYYAYRIE